MGYKFNKIKEAFSSEQGLIVLKTIFAVMMLITLIGVVFTKGDNNQIVAIFALFAILTSVMFFKKQKTEEIKS